MRRLALALLACSALTLAGCAQDFDRGPDGTVTDKVKDGKKFYLVVDPAKGGEEKKFRVSKYDYHDCNRGSKYPKCVDD
ncbi:hypothetical protein JBE04_17335 [Streptomyces sp. PRKS01-29]|uniref:Lipoprotein n=7 Tax=Streptomyces TaxID=1883 RepID=A0ABP4CIB8_9ACTN|nr:MULTISPECIES: hypothetical protein [Streptomyces]MBI0380647.1 hypothetical protein [Streptomyces albiflaviniger]GDY50425.1 hypothetical protein SVIO_010480 [Streptomyces violaceusniger]MBA6440406.1 hypothetical protein [Streptomyces sp. GMR22]MBD3002776.1 hypothetical protein [Streptomyces sp. 5-10]MBI0296181.1 hypothetical protein [Streptomyces sabulosicollis]